MSGSDRQDLILSLHIIDVIIFKLFENLHMHSCICHFQWGLQFCKFISLQFNSSSCCGAAEEAGCRLPAPLKKGLKNISVCTKYMYAYDPFFVKHILLIISHTLNIAPFQSWFNDLCLLMVESFRRFMLCPRSLTSCYSLMVETFARFFSLKWYIVYLFWSPPLKMPHCKP